MSKAEEYAWTDYETNTEIVKELNITAVLSKIQEYRRNWLQHVNRKTRNRLGGGIRNNYRPTGLRNQEQPLKRLLDV